VSRPNGSRVGHSGTGGKVMFSGRAGEQWVGPKNLKIEFCIRVEFHLPTSSNLESVFSITGFLNYWVSQLLGFNKHLKILVREKFNIFVTSGEFIFANEIFPKVLSPPVYSLPKCSHDKLTQNPAPIQDYRPVPTGIDREQLCPCWLYPVMIPGCGHGCLINLAT